MKKYTLICIGLCAAMAFTSCKSSESAYKKAYEKAKQYDTQTAQQEAVAQEAVVAPVEAKPVTQAQVVDNGDNVYVRQENVELIHGNGLNAYSVVIGSFSVLANAEALYNDLLKAGFSAQVVKNVSNGTWYRVIASTFADKAAAVASRDELRKTYEDAWLLYNAR